MNLAMTHTLVILAMATTKSFPPLALLREHLPSLSRQAVIAPAALTGLLHPRAGEPAAALEAIEQGIKGGDLEPERALRPLLDELRKIS